MNLTSCENCGVVINKDYLIFPDTHGHDSQEMIMENVEWDGEDYVAVVPCPVCGKNIRE
jgi:predicted RNA-binding Zn-ribbon protein involved in translation (DUF1610 family)